MADPNNISNFLDNLTTSMISVIITLMGFWTAFVKNLVSKKEVEDMINNQSQYMKDRQFIMERLNDSKEDTSILFRALEKNTEVMTELKVQLGMLSKTLETIEKRIEGSN